MGFAICLEEDPVERPRSVGFESCGWNNPADALEEFAFPLVDGSCVQLRERGDVAVLYLKCHVIRLCESR